MPQCHHRSFKEVSFDFEGSQCFSIECRTPRGTSCFQGPPLPRPTPPPPHHALPPPRPCTLILQQCLADRNADLTEYSDTEASPAWNVLSMICSCLLFLFVHLLIKGLPVTTGLQKLFWRHQTLAKNQRVLGIFQFSVE